MIGNQLVVGMATAASVSDQSNTSTGAFDVPSGTTAQRPSSPNYGYVRFNTDYDSIEQYTSSGWVIVNLVPILSSLTGYIWNGLATTLSIGASRFDAGASIRFYAGSTLVATVSPASTVANTSMTVNVPSVVYNQSPGVSISVQIANSNGSSSSNSSPLTVLALPSGGTISTYSSYRVHTFTGSDNFVSPISLTVDAMIVGAGGGGGFGHGGGAGGGAVLYRSGYTVSSGTYGVVVGAGATGNQSDAQNNQGNSSSAFGVTATGGGSGSNESGNDTSGRNGAGGNGANSGGGTYGGGPAGTATAPTASGWTVYAGHAGSSGMASNGVEPYTTGGGGGANANATNQNGGNGVQINIDGNNWYWGGGGGGTVYNSSTGGNGGLGGGGGASVAGASPTAGVGGGSAKNSGGNGVSSTDAAGGAGGQYTGGGGGGGANENGYGGNGGSGIVIIRYQLPT